MKATHISIIALVIIVGAGAFFFSQQDTSPGPLDGFTTCIKDSGTIFYGAFWCPHCQAQKKLFGKSSKLLPYVECSNPDGNTQTQVCKDQHIESYPTWEFPDGTRMSGELSLTTLADKTSCTLPAN